MNLDLSKLCIHTMTNRPWSLKQCVEAYAERGLKHMSVWRNVLEKQTLNQSRAMIESAGLSVASLVRGGFFCAQEESERKKAIQDNRLALEQAAEIGAPLLVLVCGAQPGYSVSRNIELIEEGIIEILPLAESLDVKLGIEPLHPMYADTRSAISSMQSANDVCDRIDSKQVGITVDVFHLWWEEHLRQEIKRAGERTESFLSMFVIGKKI